MNFFFSKTKKKRTKNKKNAKLAPHKIASSLSLSASTNDSRVRTRAHKNGHIHTHAKERDLENSLRKCGRVLLLLSMMKPRRF